jgi:glycine/D-amino acid oxidase-like deaminating enzyme
MTTAMVNAATEAIIGSQRHDVLIVGGGHNGLSAACYLAAAGKKVLLFEALDKVGGMASSGYLLSRAPRHLVHPCALDMMSMRVHPQVPLELELEPGAHRGVSRSALPRQKFANGHPECTKASSARRRALKANRSA